MRPIAIGLHSRCRTEIKQARTSHRRVCVYSVSVVTMATAKTLLPTFTMAVLQGFAVALLLLLLGSGAQSVNPASNAGLYIVPTPVYYGNALISDFNAGSGARDTFLYFDASTPSSYDTTYIFVNTDTDGFSIVSGLGPAIIELNITIQYQTDSTSAVLNFLVDGNTFASYILTNSGPSSTFSLGELIDYTLFSGSTIEVELQFGGTDAPQVSNFAISITPNPTPIYAGQALITEFNSETGPRTKFLYLDTTNATNYNTNFVLITNTTTGLAMVADIGPVVIYVQATVQYGATWSNDESSPVLMNVLINGFSAGISPLINSGPSNTYSIYRYINYALYNTATLDINLQYDSADSPQFSNVFLSITPMSFTASK